MQETCRCKDSVNSVKIKGLEVRFFELLVGQGV